VAFEVLRFRYDVFDKKISSCGCTTNVTYMSSLLIYAADVFTKMLNVRAVIQKK